MIRKAFYISTILIAPFLVVACSLSSQYDAARLDQVDSLIYTDPQAAIALLDSCWQFRSHWSNNLIIRSQLLRARAMNKAYIAFSSDSIMLSVVDFYDRHGTPNEQMEAYYLLGCAYRDMGEAPRATECYLTAIAKADTTSVDCNHRVLSSIYSQLASVFHQQFLWLHEISARKQAQFQAHKAGNPQLAISEMKLAAGAYMLLNMNDSAEVNLLEALRRYKENSLFQDEIQASTLLMHLYMDRPERQQELKHLIERYDRECNLFDEYHNLLGAKQQFYIYKAKYYENAGQLDSAEHYYRKVSHPNMAFVLQDAKYRGLLNVFEKRRLPDSIAKYSRLFCIANDSSIIASDRELTATMDASFKYNRFQTIALKNSNKAKERMTYVILLMVITFIALLASYLFWHQYRMIKHRKKEELDKLIAAHEETTRIYEDKLQLLGLLKSSHNKLLNSIKDELEKVKTERDDILTKNYEYENLIDSLCRDYKEHEEKLMRELTDLKEKVGQLEMKLQMTGYDKIMTSFGELGIIKRVRLFAIKRQDRLTDKDLVLMVEAANEHFPRIMSTLKENPNIGHLGQYVCILTMLGIKPYEITSLLGISSSQVGNLKKNVNLALFHENTARTLSKNLSDFLALEK